MSKIYRHILFDLDGTLTDNSMGIHRCIHHAMNRLGRPLAPDADLAWCIGPPLINSFARLLGSEQADRAAEAVDLYRERYRETGLLENTVYPGVIEMLTRLRDQGFDLIVTTSKPEVFARRILDHFDLARFFGEIYGIGLDGSLLDKAELVRLALDRQGFRSGEAVIIGDREHDGAAARSNRIDFIGATYGFGTRTELEAAGAIKLVDRPADIPAALGAD